MGNVFNSVQAREGGVKRKRESEIDHNGIQTGERSHEFDLITPKRRRIKSTSKYIYDTLFLNGKDSDVVIVALGKEWALHKPYLQQSGYFASIFSGSWKESAEAAITIDIPDESITENALKIAFGSMYKDDILVRPVEVVSVMAAATLLQLDSLFQHCEQIMFKTISAETACDYYQAGLTYGTPDVSNMCFQWMLHNIMIPHNNLLLIKISEELLTKVITSPNLWILQVEMNVYTLLKKWTFLVVNPSWNGTAENLVEDVESFFKEKANRDSDYFLTTEPGSRFIDIYKNLRWTHIINDLQSLAIVKADRIVPPDWLNPLYKTQWFQMLQLEQKYDGPSNIDNETFERHCMRCGRVLSQDNEYCWRWVGYNYGFDLLITLRSRTVFLKRKSSGFIFPGSVSLVENRKVMLKMTVAALDDQGQITQSKSTDILQLSFAKDEEKVLLALDANLTFPLYVIMNLLYYTPIDGGGPTQLAIPSILPLQKSVGTATDQH